MNVIEFFKKSGWAGAFLAFVCTIVIVVWTPFFVNSASDSGATKLIVAGILKPAAYFQALAWEDHHPWWAPPFFILISFLFEIVFPIVTLLWLGQTVYRNFKKPNTNQAVTYERHAKEVMKAIKALGNQKQNVPQKVRRQIVLVIKHFEKGISDIIGISKRSTYRMIWIVQNEKNPTKPVIWTKDRYPTQDEFDAITTCFHGSWFTCLDDVQRNPMFRGMNVKDIETMVCARNMGDWNIGFALLVDKRFRVPPEMQMVLKAHMGFLMLLGEMDMMQQAMVQLTKEDWKAVVTI